jgi:hypothetical protein
MAWRIPLFQNFHPTAKPWFTLLTWEETGGNVYTTVQWCLWGNNFHRLQVKARVGMTSFYAIFFFCLLSFFLFFILEI